MKGVLLCAGFGTRLRPLTDRAAKPLLPVAGRPIVDHLIDQLRPWIDEFIVVANHRFAADFREWAAADCTVLDDGATDNDSRLGAVGDLALAIAHTGTRQPLLVAGGDNLFRFDFADLFNDFKRWPRNLVLAHDEPDLARLRRTGVPEIATDGRLLSLWEKPLEPPTALACPALYLLQPPALELVARYVRDSADVDALGGFISWLCHRTPVYVHHMRGERLDVGDLPGYERAAAWLARGS